MIGEITLVMQFFYPLETLKLVFFIPWIRIRNTDDHPVYAFPLPLPHQPWHSENYSSQNLPFTFSLGQKNQDRIYCHLIPCYYEDFQAN